MFNVKAPYIMVKVLRFVFSYIPNWYKCGKEYRKQFEFLLESENWSAENIKEYQLTKMKNIVKHCYDYVPYYRKYFNENKINPNIKSIEDFKNIPMITKEIIRKEDVNLISNKYKSKEIIKATTGGTTGIPLNLYSCKVANKKVRAFVDFYWSKIGFKVKGINRIAIIRGEKPRRGISERIGSKLILSSYMLKENNILQYVKQLEKFNPDYIHCFPSAISIIANYINENKVDANFKSLKGILTSSETLYSYQKAYLKKAFNVPIYDYYGQSEKASIAISLGDGDNYYFDQRFAFNEQKNGLIISTGFMNDLMPLLRYNTEDICSTSDNYEDLINASKIEGRTQDYLIGRNDEKISLSATNFHDNTFSGISEFQYEQNEKGKVELKIVLREMNKDLDKLRINVTNLLGNVTEVKIVVVNKVQITNRGKKKLLVQNLKIEKM